MTQVCWTFVGLLAAAVACASAPRPALAEPVTADKPYEIAVAGAYVRGPKGAPVTIVEFSDFQCPYCAQATALVEQVLRAYPRDVNFVYKNFPLPMHPHADAAARAALAAGRQGKFWEMHDALFARSHDLSPKGIRTIAEQLGLDTARFDADMGSAEVKEQLNLEIGQGKAAGVRGTPSFFINNRLAENRSFEGFKAVIERELRKQTG